MRKITKTIYKFEELKKEVQDKLIEEELKAQEEFYLEEEFPYEMKEEAINLLEINFRNSDYIPLINGEVKPFWNLDYSQGSGAMIEFTLIDNKSGEKIEIKHNNSLYYHERSFVINTYANINEEELRNKIININYKLSKYGYSQIEEGYKDKDLAIEYLEENEFYANGEFYEGDE